MARVRVIISTNDGASEVLEDFVVSEDVLRVSETDVALAQEVKEYLEYRFGIVDKDLEDSDLVGLGI